MMTVSFPGGVAVEARFRDHSVMTDQPNPVGANTAMSPFDLFLASIATCMGFYALRFCQERDIPTEGLDLSLNPVRDHEKKRISKIVVNLRTPAAFPEKYRGALLRAVDLCAVKRHVLEPPHFEITLS
jgi:ribosomal protein S12 methylthiotransferase accessory factor